MTPFLKVQKITDTTKTLSNTYQLVTKPSTINL